MEILNRASREWRGFSLETFFTANRDGKGNTARKAILNVTKGGGHGGQCFGLAVKSIVQLIYKGVNIGARPEWCNTLRKKNAAKFKCQFAARARNQKCNH